MVMDDDADDDDDDDDDDDERNDDDDDEKTKEMNVCQCRKGQRTMRGKKRKRRREGYL